MFAQNAKFSQSIRKLEAKMNLLKSKKFWSVAIAIAFLLNSIPYPAYGMKRIIPPLVSGDSSGERSKKLHSLVISCKVGKFPLSHKLVHRLFQKLAQKDLSGNAIGSTPQEIVDEFGELNPSPELRAIIDKYQETAGSALRCVKTRYGNVFYRFREEAATDSYLDGIENTFSRTVVYDINEKVAELAYETFGSETYMFEHAGRYGVYIDADLYAELGKIGHKEREGLLSDYEETVFERLYAHSLFELMFRNILIAFEKYREDIKLIEDFPRRLKLFSKKKNEKEKEIDRSIQKSKKSNFKLLIERLRLLGVNQWDAEYVLLSEEYKKIKNERASIGLSDDEFMAEEADAVVFTSTTPHELTEMARDENGNYYVSIKPLKPILKRLTEQKRARGLILAEKEVPGLPRKTKAEFVRRVEKEESGRLTADETVVASSIGGDEMAKAETDEEIIALAMILLDGDNPDDIRIEAAERLNEIRMAIKKEDFEVINEVDYIFWEILRTWKYMYGGNYHIPAYNNRKTGREESLVVRSKIVDLVGVMNSSFMWSTIGNPILTTIESLRVGQTSPELGMFLIDFFSNGDKWFIKRAKRAIAISQSKLAHFEPCVVFSTVISEAISAGEARATDKKVKVYVDARSLFEQTEEGKTVLALGIDEKLSNLNKSLSTNQQVFIVVQGNDKSVKEFKKYLAVQVDPYSRRSVIFISNKEAEEKIKKDNENPDTQATGIVSQDSIEASIEKAKEVRQDVLAKRYPKQISIDEAEAEWWSGISQEWTTISKIGKNERNDVFSVILAYLGWPFNDGAPSLAWGQLYIATYVNNGGNAEEAVRRVEKAKKEGIKSFTGASPLDHEAQQERANIREILEAA